MNKAENLKQQITVLSSQRKGLARLVKEYHGALLVNKMVRCGLAETLKGMKFELKQADRKGEYALAGEIRRVINATRNTMANLLREKVASEKAIATHYRAMDELQSEIQGLDAQWEEAKAVA